MTFNALGASPRETIASRDATALGATGVAPHLGLGATAAATSTGRIVAGRFESRAELGRGSFGCVHRAYDLVSHEDVAIKIIEVSSHQFAERVRRELRAARRVTHPNVVRLHDIVEDGTSLVLSMELVHGQSLEQWLSVHTEPGEATIMRMAREIAAGVAAAHDAGVIHRDLKPANVMVRNGSGACLVTDFGVARTSERGGIGSSAVRISSAS